MEKKIIAVACVLVMLAVTLAACGERVIVEGKGGMEYVAVTDEEGNTVLNDNGEILVYVTDANGEYVTGEDGEIQINAVEFPDKVVSGSTYETPGFRFTMTQEGWTLTDTGKYVRDNTEEQVSFEVKALQDMSESTQTLDSVVQQMYESNAAYMETVRQTYPDATVTQGSETLAEQNLTAKTLEFVVRDEAGAMQYYAKDWFFLHDGTLYTVEYICNNGSYYDETIDANALIRAGLVLK